MLNHGHLINEDQDDQIIKQMNFPMAFPGKLYPELKWNW
jgi:hypothetical protein